MARQTNAMVAVGPQWKMRNNTVRDSFVTERIPVLNKTDANVHTRLPTKSEYLATQT